MATGASSCRPRDHAGRRPQRPADPDPSPLDHRLAARHKACRAGGEQDRSRGLRRDDLSRHRRRISPISPSRSAFARSSPIPISARYGDNVSAKSPSTAWYRRVAPCSAISSISTSTKTGAPQPFRMPVQWVNRPHLDFRGFAGTIAGGTIANGSTSIVVSGPAGARQSPGSCSRTGSRARRGGRRRDADARRRTRYRSRRRACRAPRAGRDVADQFAAHLVWMNERAVAAGPLLSDEDRHAHRACYGHRTQASRSTSIRCDELAAKPLTLNEVGFCNLAATMPVAFDAYAENRETGGFILIDRHHQRDGRRRHDRPRAAARDQCPSPGYSP